MVLHRKRRLSLGLGLTVILGLVGVLPPAAAAAVSTLTGETLSGSSSQGNTWSCAPSFSVSGTATAPYPGTFSESGSWNQSFDLNASFTIASGTTTITGSKGPTFSGSAFCQFAPPGTGLARADVSQVAYTATIHTPSGNFHDEGTSSLTGVVTEAGSATLQESFTSSLTEPVLIVPTRKSQCKNGGWRNYPQFKNQGRCVRFVVTGKPPPGAEHPSKPGQSKAPGRGNRSKAPK